MYLRSRRHQVDSLLSLQVVSFHYPGTSIRDTQLVASTSSSEVHTYYQGFQNMPKGGYAKRCSGAHAWLLLVLALLKLLEYCTVVHCMFYPRCLRGDD